MKTFKVANSSTATTLAGAIAWAVRDGEDVELQAIGAGAVNQAVKAVAIARGYLALEGHDIVAVPQFSVVTIPGGEERTALSVQVERRTAAPAQQEGGLTLEAGKAR